MLEQDADGTSTVQANVPSNWTAGLAFLHRYGFERVETEIAMWSDVPAPMPAMPTGVTLSRLVAPDAHAARIAAIHNVAFRDHAGFARQTPDDALRHVRDDHLWIAQLAGELVGYALVESDPGLSWLETVAVDPAYRGRGIGTALIVQACRVDGVGEGRAAGLSVSSRNSAAIRIYERLGFSRRSESGKYAAARADLVARLPASR